MTQLPSFSNQDLLKTALTHRSALNEKKSPSMQSYERMEFLGDAILEMVVSEALYIQFPKAAEGVLTAYRSALVKTATLASVAKELGLGEALMLSKGEEANGGRENEGLLADVLEAVIGALYLDQGYSAVVTFITENILQLVDTIIEEKSYRDAKSHLQELVQSKHLRAPKYTVLSETGPDHDKHFVVTVSVAAKEVGRGEGKSKQQAQQQAAQFALENQPQWLV